MGVFHFTLDKSCGKLLMQIALEKLYELDFSKAIETFTESLRCSSKIATEILLGNYILMVNESYNFKAVPKEDIKDLKDYPKLQFDILERNLLSLFQNERDVEYDTVF